MKPSVLKTNFKSMLTNSAVKTALNLLDLGNKTESQKMTAPLFFKLTLMFVFFI